MNGDDVSGSKTYMLEDTMFHHLLKLDADHVF
jgi:hypothetical protein